MHGWEVLRGAGLHVRVRCRFLRLQRDVHPQRDVLQLRNAVRPEALASFKGASLGAALKIMLVAAGMAFLGWRALRIEAPQRNRSDRRASVPLVTGPEATAGVVGRQEPGRG